MASEEKTLDEVALPTETEVEDDKECELEGCLEDSLESELTCKICQETLTKPKLLDCFHCFCEECLSKEVQEASGAIDGEPIKPVEQVECKICNQATLLPNGKVENLPSDLLLEECLNPSSDSSVIICTSCKAKEKAVAHCAKCPNYLCNNCMAAHQFMRCFDDHKVESFEDILKAGGTLSQPKPVLCEKHADENLVNFCNPCQMAVCQKCVLLEHPLPEHLCVPLSEVEGPNKDEFRGLQQQALHKVQAFHQLSKTSSTDFTDLEEQKSNARDLINETFQSYKSILEKQKEIILAELNERHKKIELAQMDTIQTRMNNEAKLESACSFAEKLLSKGSGIHISLYKKMYRNQVHCLMTCLLENGVTDPLEFCTDPTGFETTIKNTFGWFVNQKEAKPEVSATAPPVFDSKGTAFNAALAVVPGMIGAGDPLVRSGGVMTPDAAEFQISSLPCPTMTNVSQLAALTTNFDSLHTIANMANMANAPSISAAMDNMSHTSCSPVMSDSGISMDSGNSNNSATMMNVAAMVKMNIASSGHQVIMGTGMPEVSTSSAAGSVGSGSTSRTQTPMGGQGAEGLQAMLPVSPTMPAENLEQLTTLMHSQPPPSTLPFSSSISTLELQSVTGGPSEMGAVSLGSPTGSTISGAGATAPYPPVRRPNKLSAMQIRCKFGQLGPGKGQFNSPHGFCLGIEQDIIVADTNNHRIQIFEKTGEFKFQFGIPGREEGQLWYPRKVAVMRPSGKFVVCDRGNERSRMQIFTRTGHFIKKIAIRYIDIVAGLAITTSGNIVAVDSVSPTVFVISEGGDLIKWFDCSDYMREPSDIAVSNKEYFVCDFKGHCVVVFNEEGGFLRRIGCENITNYPNGIDISDAGDVLIGDSHGNRFHVAVFQRDGSLIGEFQCPYVKVSRCCGLKITSEGYVVTLAKNNHHVLVLNTLYIQ